MTQDDIAAENVDREVATRMKREISRLMTGLYKEDPIAAVAAYLTVLAGIADYMSDHDRDLASRLLQEWFEVARGLKPAREFQ